MDVKNRTMLSLQVSVDKRHYFPGDIISAEAVLRTKVPIEIRRLGGKMERMQNVKISRISSPEDELNIEKDEDVFHGYESDIVLNTSIGSGEHIFPFQFLLKTGCSGSSRLYGEFNGLLCSFENRYKLVIECLYGNSVETELEIRTEIGVSIYEDNSRKPYVDTKIRISHLLGVLNKTYLYRISTDKDIYTIGDEIIVNCLPVSIMKKRVIFCAFTELYETIVFHHVGNQVIRSRPVSSVKCSEVGMNLFRSRFRLPSTLCAVCSGEKISVGVVLVVRLGFKDGTNAVIRKHINVGRPELNITEINGWSEFTGKVYYQQILDF